MTDLFENYTPKTTLTLSAAPDLDLELAKDRAYIEQRLGRINRVRAMGFPTLADAYLDRLFDSILSPDDDDELTESELRLMDGNR